MYTQLKSKENTLKLTIKVCLFCVCAKQAYVIYMCVCTYVQEFSQQRTKKANVPQ